MLTREIPFKGLEGLQVAWLVVEKNEVNSKIMLIFAVIKCFSAVISVVSVVDISLVLFIVYLNILPSKYSYMFTVS